MGTDAKKGGALWHRDSEGLYWTGHHYHRTREQLIAECESTLAALRSQGQADAVDDAMARRLMYALPLGCAGHVDLAAAKHALTAALAQQAKP